MTGNAVEDTTRIRAVTERVIRENPDRSLWIHRRLKAHPQGERPFY
jgi:lauroyl/myristoyl acyltransferase